MSSFLRTEDGYLLQENGDRIILDFAAGTTGPGGPTLPGTAGYGYRNIQMGASDIRPILSGGTTQAAISEQGITYNETGVIYNDSRYTYGGLYGFSDVKPTISLAKNIRPTITGYADVYTQFVPPPTNSSQVLGPGFLTFMNQP